MRELEMKSYASYEAQGAGKLIVGGLGGHCQFKQGPRGLSFMLTGADNIKTGVVSYEDVMQLHSELGEWIKRHTDWLRLAESYMP